jgi:hypothetical protein
MQALERIVGTTTWLGSIGALGGVALLLIAGSLFARMRRFLAGESASPGQPRDKGAAALEMIASLAAAVGVLGTFFALRADGSRLIPLFAPVLAGQVVFVFCQGALGLFRSWNVGPTPSPLLAPFPQDRAGALPPPLSQSIGGDPWPVGISRPADGVPGASPPPRRHRRPPTPPLRISRMDAVARGAFLLACMIGSILVHAAVLFVALRVHAGSEPVKSPERAGVFAASLVPASRQPSPVFEEIKKEEPPPPPKPEAPKPEPPPEPPKPEPKPEAPSEAAKEAPVAAATEQPKPELSPIAKETTAKAEAPAEKPKTEAPPAAPPPPPAAEAAPSESPARKAETESAKAEAPKPSASAPPPRSRVTESPETPAGSQPAEPTPAPAAAPPPKAGAEPRVLGFGEPPKNPENPEGPAGSDPRGTASDISTLKDYRKFLAREMKSGAADGPYVPHLRFGDNTAQENREITRYFGMELIAYPKNQKFYVYISPEQDLYSRSNDFTYIQNFSSRAIFRSSPYFDSLRAEAAKRVGAPAESLVLAQLLKPASATYIGWKEAECARRAGVTLAAVEACDATFVKTPFGVWIVRIDRLVLKDGRTMAVEDFEWTRVAASAGGHR